MLKASVTINYFTMLLLIDFLNAYTCDIS